MQMCDDKFQVLWIRFFVNFVKSNFITLLKWNNLFNLFNNQRDEMKSDIVGNLDGFVNMLRNACGSLEDNILLQVQN